MRSDERGSIDGVDFALHAGLTEGIIGASANELQVPLSLIRQLSLALEDMSLPDDERKQLAERLTLTVERTLRLTQNLRFDQRLSGLVNLEPVNPVAVCQEVVHELTPLFRAHGRALVARPRSKAPLMVADRALLRQLLLGFVDNALHYGSDEHPVQLVVGGSGGKVRVGVRDYGPAVAPDVLKRLDERIARQSQVLIARRPRASGVNLAIARQLAEMMGGRAGVVRHRDGATFYVDMTMSGQMSLL